MRAALILPLLLVAACSKDVPAGGAQAVADEADNVPCALAGAREFKAVCTREQALKDGEDIWVIRHPDGGFRRFVLIEHGTRIATADGVAEVDAKRVGSELEVRVGDDRYRFPAAPEASDASSD